MTFSGNNNQYITGTTSWRSITVNKTGGNLYIGTNLIISNGVTLTAGNIVYCSGTSQDILKKNHPGNIIIEGVGTILNITRNTVISGNITVNEGATWNNPDNKTITLSGDLDNNGTFNAGTGNHTFIGSSKNITGTSSTTIPKLIINGSYSNNLSDTNPLIVSTSLSGSGSLSQNSNSGLIIGGAISLSTFVANASGNKVIYNGSTTQTARGTLYYNLVIQSTSTVTFSADMSAENLNILQGILSSNYNININNSTEIRGRFTFYNPTSSKSFNNVEIFLGGEWNSTVASDYFIAGNFHNDGTVNANNGNYYFTGSNKIISGNAETIIPNIIISGSYNNNGILRSSSISGTGMITNNGVLKLEGSFTVQDFDFYSNANTVYAKSTQINATKYRNLYIDNNGGISTLSNDVEVLENLDFPSHGILDLNGFTLTFSEWNNSIPDDLSIDKKILLNGGKIRVEEVGAGEKVVFPVSVNDSDTAYSRIDITNFDTNPAHSWFEVENIHFNIFTDGSSDGSMGGEKVNRNSVNIMYNMHSDSENADVTLFWNSALELVDFDRNMCTVNHYDETMGWEVKGMTGAALNYSGDIYYQTGRFDGFSGGGVSGGENPLPVELILFDAEKYNDEVKLIWVTASEKNNDFFTIEKSADGENFSPITTIKGSGNSSNKTEYSFIDENPIKGHNYYRLRQTDFNGENKCFKVVSINYNRILDVNIYPNPSKGGFFNISFNSETEDQVKINIISTDGQIVFEQINDVETANNLISINPDFNINPGIYLISVQGKSLKFFTKLVID